MRIIDGQANFNAEQETVYRLHPQFASLAFRAGVAVPPVAEVSRAKPVPARINAGRLIADCPDCAGAEFVWRDAPLLMCANCWNGKVGGKWRRVALPDDLDAIEAALEARPDPATRNWSTGETVKALLAENKERG